MTSMKKPPILGMVSADFCWNSVNVHTTWTYEVRRTVSTAKGVLRSQLRNINSPVAVLHEFNSVHQSSSPAVKHARSLPTRLRIRRAANNHRLYRYLPSGTFEAMLICGREMRDVWNVLEDDQNVSNIGHEYSTSNHASTLSSFDGGQNVKCGADS